MTTTEIVHASEFDEKVLGRLRRIRHPEVFRSTDAAFFRIGGSS